MERTSWSKKIIEVILALGGIFYLYTAATGQWGVTRQRGILLVIAFIYIFMVRNRTQKLGSRYSFLWDAFLSLVSVAAYIPSFVYDYADESHAIAGPSDYELIAGGIFLLVLLEASRRSVGLAFTIFCMAAIAFSKWGCLISNQFSTPIGGWGDIVDYITYSAFGIYGVALYVAATVVVVLVIFGALLQRVGGTALFSDLPQALFGTYRGGPAKVAVVGSSLMGMLSGSPGANAATVGVFTIPMMKSIGYSPTYAAAIETAASCGGAIMPPIMGTVAFIMADVLQVSYWDVAVAAFLPACLYYTCLFIQVDLHAAKTGLVGVPRSQLPPLKKTIIRASPMLLPVGALVYFLGVAMVTSQKAGLMAIVALAIASWFYKDTRLTFKKIYSAFVAGMQVMGQIAIACAAAGIIIASIDLSGLGMSLSSALINLAHGNLPYLLVLTAVASIIMGTGLSATPCYLLLAFIVAPALIKLGVPPMNAHLFILYFGCLSQLTPPEALCAYTSAGIAGANPFTTAFLSCRIAIIGFIVPFFFVYHNTLLLQGSPIDVIYTVFTSVLGVIALSVSLEGYALNRISIAERVLLAILGLALIAPTPKIVDAVCLLGIIFLVLRRRLSAKIIPGKVDSV